MTLEIGNMFGSLGLSIDKKNSKNEAGRKLFEDIDNEQMDELEAIFPASGFIVLSVICPEKLKISNFGEFEWDWDGLLFTCRAQWTLNASTEDHFKWGEEFREMWSQAHISLSHANHPELFFNGVFYEAPEYSS